MIEKTEPLYTTVYIEESATGTFGGYIKELPNVHAVGNTKKELLDNLVLALHAHLNYVNYEK